MCGFGRGLLPPPRPSPRGPPCGRGPHGPRPRPLAHPRPARLLLTMSPGRLLAGLGVPQHDQISELVLLRTKEARRPQGEHPHPHESSLQWTHSSLAPPRCWCQLHAKRAPRLELVPAAGLRHTATLLLHRKLRVLARVRHHAPPRGRALRMHFQLNPEQARHRALRAAPPLKVEFELQ